MIPFSGFGGFWQLAWVTPDLETSLETFRTVYGVPSFFVMDQEFPARVFGETGVMKLRIALANVDEIQLELIQPMGGIDRIYREVLPADGSHANVFHHVCMKVEGELDDWDAHLDTLKPPHREIAYVGDVGEGARFVYTDERKSCGFYVEHVWFSGETQRTLAAAIPHFQSKA